MKSFSSFLFAGLVLHALAVFLPYMVYDDVSYEWTFLFVPSKTSVLNQTLYGFDTSLSYYTAVIMFFPVLYYVRKKSKRSAFHVLLWAILVGIFQFVLFFLLTAEPSFYRGYDNVRLSYGYWANTLGSVLCIAGAVYLFNSAKSAKIKSIPNNDLLDDSI